jgi:uncharacterized protein YajQ (UPF0234 family)
MPSFDIVSEVDMHEATNAIDQANREVNTRFDFKGTNAVFELSDEAINLKAQNEFQLKQMLEILQTKLAKRNIDISCLDIGEMEIHMNQARQKITIKQGIDSDLARTLVKTIKASKLKVQAAIQEKQVRVTGKKRDDLQDTIALLREEKINQPLQYTNFRD